MSDAMDKSKAENEAKSQAENQVTRLCPWLPAPGWAGIWHIADDSSALPEYGHGDEDSTISPDEGMVLLLEHGNADLFLVPDTGGLQGGAREYLFSAADGQMLLLPATGIDCGYTLVPVPGPGASFWVLPRKAFASLLAKPHCNAACGTLVNQAARQLRERLCQPTGQSMAAARESAESRDWQPFEIAQLATLSSLPHGRVHKDEVDENIEMDEAGAVAAAGDMLQKLEALYLELFQTALQQRQYNDEAELSRLQRRAESGRQTMANALGGLASLFEHHDSRETVGDDALLDACRIVGKHIGLKFVLPPGGVQAGVGKHHDPVTEIATASGVRSRIVALKGQWWRYDNGPLLAFSAAGHTPLALLPRAGGGYDQVDRKTGKKSRITVARAEQLAQFAYVFYRNLPGHALSVGDILSFTIRGLHTELWGIVIITLISGMLGMAVPLVTSHLYDTVFPAADRGQMLQVVVMILVISLVHALNEITRNLLQLRFEGRASNDLQAAIWDRVLKLPLPFFRQFSSGDLANRINGVNAVRQAMSGTVLSSIISGLFSFLNLFLMFYYSPRLTLLAMLLVLIAMLFNLLQGSLNIKCMRKVSALNGKAAGLVMEYLNGIAKLRATGSESRAFANWARVFREKKRYGLLAGTYTNISGVFGSVFPLLANAVLFILIAQSLEESLVGQLTTGEFIAFGTLFAMYLSAMLVLVRNSMTLVNIGPTLERTRPILQALPEVDESKRHPGTLSGAIEISNLSFAYDAQGPMILDKVSLTIREGEFVALVGSSGSGKSTLLRLMLGFEKPLSGGIYYDGKHLAELDVVALRRQLGVVLQGGRVMSGNIFSNIVGSSNLQLADAWAAARACGLDQDIQAMAMGMNTIVGDGGATLSGGQRQRLLIARAIAHQPRIVYFDEATSALDNQTQAIVSRSMEQLHATRIIIAHRLSTIINADRIFVLDQGRLVQTGTYQELMQQPGLFAELAKRQIA